MSVVEYAAAIVVDKALRQRPLGDDHIVSVELDVEIVHLVGALSLHDRGAINEVLGFDQHAVDVHGVVRRNPEVASRHMVVQGAGLDADRQDVFLPRGEAPAIAPSPDPFDRPQGAGHGHHFVADFQILHALLPALRLDQRAGAIADRADIDETRSLRHREGSARIVTFHGECGNETAAVVECQRRRVGRGAVSTGRGAGDVAESAQSGDREIESVSRHKVRDRRTELLLVRAVEQIVDLRHPGIRGELQGVAAANPAVEFKGRARSDHERAAAGDVALDIQGATRGRDLGVIDDIADQRSRTGKGAAVEFDRGRIDGAVVEDDCAGFLNELSGVERRAGIDGEIPGTGSSEGAVDLERVIRGDGEATGVGRVTGDRRRPIDGEGAALDVQGALRKAAVDLGHASGGLDEAPGAEHPSGRSIFEAGAVIDRAVVDHGRAVRQRRAIQVVERCAIDQGGAIFIDKDCAGAGIGQCRAVDIEESGAGIRQRRTVLVGQGRM